MGSVRRNACVVWALVALLARCEEEPVTAVRAAGRSAGGAMSAGVGMSGGGLETGPAGWIVVSSVDGSWHVLDASTGDEKLSITADAGDETMRRSNESGLDGGLDMTVPLHTPPLAATGDGSLYAVRPGGAPTDIGKNIKDVVSKAPVVFNETMLVGALSTIVFTVDIPSGRVLGSEQSPVPPSRRAPRPSHTSTSDPLSVVRVDYRLRSVRRDSSRVQWEMRHIRYDTVAVPSDADEDGTAMGGSGGVHRGADLASFSTAGRVLHLVSRASRRVLWSRPMTSLPLRVEFLSKDFRLRLLEHTLREPPMRGAPDSQQTQPVQGGGDSSLVPSPVMRVIGAADGRTATVLPIISGLNDLLPASSVPGVAQDDGAALQVAERQVAGWCAFGQDGAAHGQCGDASNGKSFPIPLLGPGPSGAGGTPSQGDDGVGEPPNQGSFWDSFGFGSGDVSVWSEAVQRGWDKGFYDGYLAAQGTRGADGFDHGAQRVAQMSSGRWWNYRSNDTLITVVLIVVSTLIVMRVLCPRKPDVVYVEVTPANTPSLRGTAGAAGPVVVAPPAVSLGPKRSPPRGLQLAVPAYAGSRLDMDFEKIKILGSGAFGTVFKVQHRLDERMYAVKLIDLTGGKPWGSVEAQKQEYLREVKLLARLDHENVCRYYCAWLERRQSTGETPRRPSVGWTRAIADGRGDKAKPNTPGERASSGRKSASGIGMKSGSGSGDATQRSADDAASDLSDESSAGLHQSSEGGTDKGNNSSRGWAGWSDDPTASSVGSFENTSGEGSADVSANDRDMGMITHTSVLFPNDFKDTSLSKIDTSLSNPLSNGVGGADDDSDEGSQQQPTTPLPLPALQKAFRSFSSPLLSRLAKKEASKTIFDDDSSAFWHTRTGRAADSKTGRAPGRVSSGTRLCIQMQFCGDMTLRDWMRDNPPRTGVDSDRKICEQQRMRLLLQLINGLHHVHSQGIIHRDLKPDNIFLRRRPGRRHGQRMRSCSVGSGSGSGSEPAGADVEPSTGDATRQRQQKESDAGVALDSKRIESLSADLELVIGDFGLSVEESKIANGADEDALLLESKGVGEVQSLKVRSPQKEHSKGVGTPWYMSPEQRQSSQYDSKSDMYSLGMVLFEIFSVWNTTHQRFADMRKLREKRELDRAFCDAWPQEARLVLSLTHRDPAQRPDTAALLRDDFVRHYLTTAE